MTYRLYFARSKFDLYLVLQLCCFDLFGSPNLTETNLTTSSIVKHAGKDFLVDIILLS